MNGSHAHLQVFEPAPMQPQAPDKPADPVEDVIGEAVAACAIAIAAAVEDGCRHGGVVNHDLKERTAARLAAVAQLQLEFMGSDDDFTRAARTAGKCTLRQHFDDSVNPHLIDAAIDSAIDPVIQIVAGVVRDERIYMAARAH
jgi:hypothetical protein